MHEHERDLIMALAEGALDAGAAAEAEASIASCPDCLAELQLQRTAVAGLARMPGAEITEMESARLRRDLRQELGLVEPVPVVAPRRTRWVPIAAIGAAAAVLIGLIAVAPALELFGTTGDDSLTFAAESATTITATTSAPEAAAAPTAEESRELTAGTDTPAAAEAPAGGVRASVEDLDQLRAAFVASGTAFAQPETSAASEDASVNVATRAEECGRSTVAGVDGADDFVLVAAGPYQGVEALVIAYVSEDPDDVVVIAHDAATCEELDRATS